MRIHTPETFEAVDWPDPATARYLGKLCAQPRHFVANVDVPMGCLAWRGKVLPLSLGRRPRIGSFVGSPYSQYIHYAEEELRLVPTPARFPLKLLIRCLGWWLRKARFNQVVMVNNWLLTTNLYQDWDPVRDAEVPQFLIEAFPDRAILFRTVNPYLDAALLQTLESQGYRKLVSRQVYLRDSSVAANRQLRNDLKLYRRTRYQLVHRLRDEELERARELYELLYIRKYSIFNPQFTVSFLRLLQESGAMEFRGFRSPEGRLDAFFAFNVRQREFGQVMSQPLFGYDTSLPAELGLYRLLSTQTYLEGLEHDRMVHMSAGVGEFKRNRGATPMLEYNCVYHDHLPPARRYPWLVLEQLLARIAGPLLEKLAL